MLVWSEEHMRPSVRHEAGNEAAGALLVIPRSDIEAHKRATAVLLLHVSNMSHPPSNIVASSLPAGEYSWSVSPKRVHHCSAAKILRTTDFLPDVTAKSNA